MTTIVYVNVTDGRTDNLTWQVGNIPRAATLRAVKSDGKHLTFLKVYTGDLACMRYASCRRPSELHRSEFI